MKAAFIEQFGGAEVLKYGDLPDPVAAPGEVHSGHWLERHLYPGDGLLYHQAPRMRLKWMRAGERLYIGQLPLSPS